MNMLSARKFWLIILGIVILFGVYGLLNTRPVTDFAKTQEFIVAPDDSLGDTISRLSDEGFIKNKLVASLAYRLLNASSYIEPGGYELSPSMSTLNVVQALKEPQSRWASFDEGLDKTAIAKQLSAVFGWEKSEERRFVRTLTAIQWDRFNANILPIVEQRLSWGETEQKAFATMATFFSDPEYDFMRHLYVPGNYLIGRDDSFAMISSVFVSRFAEAHEHDLDNTLSSSLDEVALGNVRELVQGEVELLPDLIPLPASDIVLEQRDGRDILSFTTTYWNDGKGVFELVADPQTRDIEGDVERDVFQRIYRTDSLSRDRLVGNFLWHQIHLHYHFSGFVEYALEPIDIGGATFAGAREKATFCIRDVDPVSSETIESGVGPTYRICGKERQGISVGWGDSYYFTYVDQHLDITDTPKGTYKLVFTVNPDDRFEELSNDNNISEVLLKLDVEHGVVEVLNNEV